MRSKRFTCLIIVFLMLILYIPTYTSAEYASSENQKQLELYGYNRNNTYEAYLGNYKGSPSPDREIIIQGPSFTAVENATININSSLDGRKDVLEWTNQEGWVEWTVDIPEEGFYNLAMSYYPLQGTSGDIELQLAVDGKFPFNDALKFIFRRVWKDASEIKRDARDNDLTPRQADVPMWQEADFRDTEGFVTGAYKFHFTRGQHTIRLICKKESFAIEYLKLYNKKLLPSYKEVQDSYNNNGYMPVSDILIKKQAEETYLKSDPTLHSIYDRSGPLTEPYSPSKIRLNTIGAINWRYPGQWMSWEFDVPESGLYKIAMRSRQNITRGIFSTRKITLDGKTPFKEMENVKFPYDLNWRMKVLGDDEPFLFYLEKGTHELKMEAVIGEIGETLKTINEIVYQLNTLYRKIIMITSTTPDINRDYNLEKAIPEMVPEFTQISRTLNEQADRIEKVTGQSGSEAAVLREISDQLKSLADQPHTINERLQKYKDNISTLGAWILQIKEEPLELDYIVVASPDKELPRLKAGWFEKVVHEFRAVIASFFEDYNSIGSNGDTKKAVKVWIGTGRDQAEVVKMMIDDLFTPETGIPINLSLVQSSVLEATMAGKGPDVAIMAPVNPFEFAVRGALVNLERFSDFEDVKNRFHPSVMVPFRYKESYYALPETQVFPMVFYRTDIFKELGISAPETWKDLYRIIPILQRANMELGMLPSYSALVYQRGSQFYKNDLTATNFDDPQYLNALKEWTGWFTRYGCPYMADYQNRFRTGEMPLVLNDYTFANSLEVSAPEIRNLWDMVPMTGTSKPDGTIDRSQAGGIAGIGSSVTVGASSGGCVIFNNCKDIEGAWEFIKWWTSADVQVRYNREMENLLGPSGRWPTANQEAFERIPWSRSQRDAIKEQWKFIKGVPAIPGDYFVARNIANVQYDIIFELKNPRETLVRYNRTMNEEIKRKRIEFGLDKQ